MINKTNYNAITPFQLSIMHKDEELPIKLLEYHCDINAKTKYLFTPLHIASDRGKQRVVDKLLEYPDIEVAETTATGYTAMHLASEAGHMEIALKLLQHGSMIKYLQNMHNLSVGQPNPINNQLWDESRKGKITSVRRLVAKGASCLIDKRGNTNLHQACKSSVGALEKAQVLFQIWPSQARIKNNEGNLPIHLAATHHDERTIKFLVSKCNINLFNR